MKTFKSDIDIDFGDRTSVLQLIKYAPASIMKNNVLTRHSTGIYVTEIPQDPFTGIASLDYKIAEERGYIKLDFLNVHLYSLIESEQHLIELMSKDPPWDKLYEKEFCEKLIHIGNHYDSLIKMPEKVDNIEKMAMFLALIRPSKRHLIGKTWEEVSRTIWEKSSDGSYGYKKSHGIAYAHLVCLHMVLL